MNNSVYPGEHLQPAVRALKASWVPSFDQPKSHVANLDWTAFILPTLRPSDFFGRKLPLPTYKYRVHPETKSGRARSRLEFLPTLAPSVQPEP